eukprot:1181754-Prorocentrum_minimum.AAC.10
MELVTVEALADQMLEVEDDLPQAAMEPCRCGEWHSRIKQKRPDWNEAGSAEAKRCLGILYSSTTGG